MIDKERREFFKHLAALTGTVVIAPMAFACAEKQPSEPTIRPIARVDASGAPLIPQVRPENWDAIAYNRERGMKGAIPESYHADINGPEGEKGHLGKHLPYIPDIAGVPEGYIPIMWGDPSKGFTQHPSSPKHSENYPLGHWYDWVRIRKATEGEAHEAESQFHAWPGPPGEIDNTIFSVHGEGAITDNAGKNTIYMLTKPSDVMEGDPIRIHGHCLYHGEYVDFIDYKTS